MNEIKQFENDALRFKARLYKMDAERTNDLLIRELLLAKLNLIFLQLEQNGCLQKTSHGQQKVATGMV